jgi:hypothetical protein
MGTPHWRLRFAATVGSTLCLLTPVLGAELQLRESLLREQSNRVTITLDAEIAKIGSVHHLDTSNPVSGDDCDVHMGLSSDDLRVPFVGEVKNACSTEPPSHGTWSKAILAERHGQLASFAGAFRIWLEHPPRYVQTESNPEPVNGSNPPHQVELHPLTKIGNIDLHSNVRWIEKDGDQGFGYGSEQFRDARKWTIVIDRLSYHGTRYISIKGPKFKYNHWTLKGRVSGPVEQLEDGVRAQADILGKNGKVLADHVSLLGAAGTAGGDKLGNAHEGQTFEFLAVSTLDIPTVLNEVESDPKKIAVPIAFIVLDTR